MPITKSPRSSSNSLRSGNYYILAKSAHLEYVETLDVVDDGRHDLGCEGRDNFIQICRQTHFREIVSHLNGGGASPDDGDPFAAVVVAVVPAGRVERRPFKPGRTGKIGDLERDAGCPNVPQIIINFR